MSDTQSTLDARGSRYGDFVTQAAISQALRGGLMQHYFTSRPNREPMPPYMAEAIDMICHKLGRVANGDPLFIDNWRDIAGYAQLVVQALQSNPNASDVDVTYYTLGSSKTDVLEPVEPINEQWGH